MWGVVWVSGGKLWEHAVDLLVGLAVHGGLLKGHWVLALLRLRRVVHRRRPAGKKVEKNQRRGRRARCCRGCEPQRPSTRSTDASVTMERDTMSHPLTPRWRRVALVVVLIVPNDDHDT